jgi:hypothetical protein
MHLVAYSIAVRRQYMYALGGMQIAGRERQVGVTISLAWWNRYLSSGPTLRWQTSLAM